MNELPLKIKKAISRYQPVEVEGFTFYPITVEEYDNFLIASSAIDFMQQSLPVALLSVPLLTAYWQLDIENAENGTPVDGKFSRALLFLAMALRIMPDAEPIERVKAFQVEFDPKNHKKLISLRFRLNGTEQCKITPVQFQRIRPILAAQNGIKLQSDTANPELVQAERDIAEQNNPNLDINLEDMICSVSALTGTTEDEIYGWPIKKLNQTVSALRRAMDYIICGVGATQGAKWKNGNPSPSPFFERTKEKSSALIAAEQFANGGGARAISNPGKQVT